MTMQGVSQGWFWNALEAIFKKWLHKEENKSRLRILGMGIYSLILFLLIEEMVNFKAINVFKNV
jgi:hypothetical protein